MSANASSIVTCHPLGACSRCPLSHSSVPLLGILFKLPIRWLLRKIISLIVVDVERLIQFRRHVEVQFRFLL